MTKKRPIVFSDTAATKLRKLPKERRKVVVETISDELSALGSGKSKKSTATRISGSKYLEVSAAGEGVALLRPLTKTELAEFLPDLKRGYYIADLRAADG
ncbi:hypothetical protein [Streptomyces virginiae]|uniref:hypothetical protein n=1 Tax=Streptomyces virginiae TaxID=1961 RepID=UPI00324998A9